MASPPLAFPATLNGLRISGPVNALLHFYGLPMQPQGSLDERRDALMYTLLRATESFNDAILA